MGIKIGGYAHIPFFINQTDLLAGTSQEVIAPVSGFLDGLDTTVQAAVTTGGTIVVKNNAGTNVAGLSNTVANAAAKGTRATAKATAKDPTRVVTKGDRIQIAPASFATAGAVNGFVTINTGV